MYIYLSNEEDTQVEVYFDDFEVEHIKSPVVQMDDYYPFGLTFNSHSRENSVPNMFQYNGKEKQDELGLDWLDYGARMFMPEIGRWVVSDPLAENYESISPYNFVFNNPIRFFDFDGGGPGDIVIIIPGADFMMNGDLGDIGGRAHEITNEGGIVKVFPGQVMRTVTRDVYDPYYQDRVPKEVNELIPGQFNKGFSTQDLDVATQAMFDYIVQNKERTEGKLVIYGYSWGGVLANHLAKRLEEKNIKVDQLFLVDAAAGRSSHLIDREISDNVVNATVHYTENKESNNPGEYVKQKISGSEGGPGHRKEGSTAKPVNNIRMKFRWGENGKTKVNINHSNIDTESWRSIVRSINTFLNSK